MSNAPASEDSESGSDSGGGISGFVGDSASDAGTMAPEDSGSSAAGDSSEPLVAAADPEASSDSSSDTSDSSSTTTADSSSTSESTSSSDTSDISTSDTRTGVNNAAREVNIVVAIGGSNGGVGTGGVGGGNQDCGENCGNSGGGIVLPGGTPGGGLGTPGETGGIGGGFGTGSGIGGTGPGLPTNGGSNPEIFGGGLAGGTRTPIGGNIDGFIESGISGNVLAGKGSFRGNVDVFGSNGAGVGFLGSVSTDRNIGLDLGNQAALAGKGLSENIAGSALLEGGAKLDNPLGSIASSGERFSATGIDNSGLAGKFDASAVKFNSPIAGSTFDTSTIKLDNPASDVSFDTSSIKVETRITDVDASSLRIQTPAISGGNKFNFGNTFRGGGGQFQSIPKELN